MAVESSRAPESWYKQAQDDKNFDPTQHHQPGEKQLGMPREVRIILRRPYGAKSRADVVQHGRDCTGAVDEFVFYPAVPRGVRFGCDQKEPGADKDGENKSKIDKDVMSEVLVSDRFATHSEWPYDLGMKRVFDFETKDFDEQNVPNHFETASRTAGATTNEHQHKQQPTTEIVPGIEIVRAESGGRDN